MGAAERMTRAWLVITTHQGYFERASERTDLSSSEKNCTQFEEENKNGWGKKKTLALFPYENYWRDLYFNLDIPELNASGGALEKAEPKK